MSDDNDFENLWQQAIRTHVANLSPAERAELVADTALQPAQPAPPLTRQQSLQRALAEKSRAMAETPRDQNGPLV
jgi:hypothetical protein